MHKLLLTFLLVFLGTSILGAIYQGGGGIVSTTLAENIISNTTYIPASDTSLFASKDIITIGNEQTLYSSKDSGGFNVQTRGYGDTTAAAHNAGSMIYTQEAGVINNALGFNVGVEVETGGTFGVVTMPIKFFTTTLPHLIVLNASFLKTPELSVIAIVWLVAGVALLVTLAIQIAPIAISIATGIVGLIRR